MELCTFSMAVQCVHLVVKKYIKLTSVRRTGAERSSERTYICEEDWC